MSAAARKPANPPRSASVRSAAPAALDRDGDAQQARDRRLGSLLAAAAAGDASAFEAFYDATFAYARTVARRLLHDGAACEDLLADCYFEAWRKAGHFDAARGSPVTWLLTLVRSRGLDALRAAAARPDRAALTSAATEGDAPDATATAPADADADPAERLWRRQAGAELHAALATLSAPERWVLGLAYLRELSHAEIAQCTGLPLGTVKSHVLRAQNKLRVVLAAGAPGPLGARTDAGSLHSPL
jgi:RNA polymerase sigma-70 factor (ECF subfamily)